MKTIITCFLLFLTLFTCSGQGKFNVNLKVENLKSDSVLIGYTVVANSDIEFVDTAVIQNGSLSYQMNVKEFVRGTIIPFSLFHKFKNGKTYPTAGSKITFYINANDHINIDASIMDKQISYVVIGNKISQQKALAHIENLALLKDQIVQAAIYEQKKNVDLTNEEIKAYQAIRNKNRSDMELNNITFIRKHPDYEASAELMMSLQKDSVVNLFKLLTPEVKQSYFGKVIDLRMKGWYQTKIGNKLPDFEASTIDNKLFKLSSLTGKFVLLDFWGSWCKPCIEEFPKMKNLKIKYPQDLEIVGLIAKDNKINALKAIKQYQLPWTQLFSETNEFVDLFGINSYPTKVLLSPKGAVVKIFIGTSDEVFKDIAALITMGK